MVESGASAIAGSRRWLLAIACGLWAGLWAGCHPTLPDQTTTILGTVTRVNSGQTVEIAFSHRESTPLTVRLAGLSAPDHRQQPWGAEARQALSDLVLQQPIRLEPVGALDGYGRQWGYLWQGDRLINEHLLAAGHGVAELRATPPQATYAHRLAHAQHQARLLGRGLWNPDNPMRQTPVEFRQQLPAAP